MIHFSKTARNFFIILPLRQAESISFHMKLVSELAALIWKPGVHRNTDRKNQVMCPNIGKSLNDMTILDVIFLQTGSKFFHDTFSRQSRQYFFHINLVSQLAALVCQSGVHRNNDRRKQSIGRNLVISLYDILLDDVFLKKRLEIFSQYIPCLN